MELDNKLSIKDIYKIIGILIILSAFSAIILNFVLQIDLPPYIKISTNSTWIGFWGNLIGTIIGACVTMIGLIMTFKENQHQIEEEKKFNIRPHIVYRVDKIDGSSDLELKKNDPELILESGDDELDIPSSYRVQGGETRIANIDYEYTGVSIHIIDGEIRDDVMGYSIDKDKCSYIISQPYNANFHFVEMKNIGLNSSTYIHLKSITYNNRTINIDQPISSGIMAGEKHGILLRINLEDSEYYSIQRKLILKIEYNNLTQKECFKDEVTLLLTARTNITLCDQQEIKLIGIGDKTFCKVEEVLWSIDGYKKVICS